MLTSKKTFFFLGFISIYLSNADKNSNQTFQTPLRVESLLTF